MPAKTVLYVEPDGKLREQTGTTLRRELSDTTVLSGDSLYEATKHIESNDIDCLVTEYQLPDATGLELISRVRDAAPDASCILFTATDSDSIVTASVDVVITEFLSKESSEALDRLVQLVRATIQSRSQRSYPVSKNENERLEVLSQYDFNDESLREALDRITRLATAHFETPFASINIISDHSQNVLACHGADGTSTAREDSVCTYSILNQTSVTVIRDLAEDPRFSTNTLIRDSSVRFYAGYPVVTPGGISLGTLCVYDMEPRTFTPAEQEYLQLLAEEAMAQIELHQHLAKHVEYEPSTRQGEEQ